MKHFSFGWIWGFRKILLIKPSSSNPNAPNSNETSKMNFIYMFSEENCFLCSLLDDCCCSLRVRLLLQSTAFQLCEYLYWILHDMRPNQWNVIFKPMLMKTKGSHRRLTFAKRVHKTCLSESARSPYKAYYCEIWLGKIHTHDVVLHECLVNGWGLSLMCNIIFNPCIR